MSIRPRLVALGATREETCHAHPGGLTAWSPHTRGRSCPQPLIAAFSLLVGEPLHFIMQTRQFHGLRTRVSAAVVNR